MLGDQHEQGCRADPIDDFSRLVLVEQLNAFERHLVSPGGRALEVATHEEVIGVLAGKGAIALRIFIDDLEHLGIGPEVACCSICLEGLEQAW
ncbi:hypothetical protein D3C76_1611330 [compost metagenome]